MTEYGTAVVSIGVATLLRYHLQPILGDRFPFATLLLAVLVSTWYGGFGPGLFASGLGVVASLVWLLPADHILMGGVSTAAALALYLTVSVSIALLGGKMRSAQRRAERARDAEQVQRQWLSVTLQSIGDAVIVADREGQVTLLNPVAQTLTGWSQEEAKGKPLEAILKLVNEQTREPVANPARRALQEGVVVGLVNRTMLVSRQGTEYAIDDSAAPIRDERGLVRGAVLIFRDVTARRRAEKESAERLVAARLLAAIVESSEDAIISKSLEGIIQSWNAAAERLFGYTPEQVIGKHVSILIPPDRASEEDRIIASLKAGQPIEHYETVRVRRDGQPVWVSLTISPVRDETGRVIGASKIVRDITGRRQAEERERQLLDEAAAASAKFRAFFDQGPAFAGVMALDGTLLEANRLSLEACGYTREQVIGKKFWDCPWWSPSAELVEIIHKASVKAAAGESFREELPYFVADGSERIVDFVLLPIKDDAGRVRFLAPSGTDITERKQAEADRQKFVTVVETSTDFIGMCDLKGVPFFINRAGLKMVGLDSIEQARRVQVQDFFFPEDQARLLHEFFPAVLAKGHGEIDVRFRNFKTGEARWMAYKVLVLTDSSGQPIGFATVSQDVTDRRLMEENLRHLADDLSDADRRKDEFLATLAHELRNPLAPIRNSLQIMRLRKVDDPQILWARDVIERQTLQMTRLIDDLLDISRITRGRIQLKKEIVELGDVVRRAVETARPLIEERHHDLNVSIPKPSIPVNVDPVRLEQILTNLLNNAAKYTEPHGHIWLTVEPGNPQVAVRVRDDGIGIAADLLPRVFDMFVQAEPGKDRAKGGLGIGLSLVQRLVEMHGGSVSAHSDGPGRGSEFVVRLPAVIPDGHRDLPAIAAPEPAHVAAGRHILVVDDNVDAADSLALLLRLRGHHVRVVHDGESALESVINEVPELIFLDIGLPGMSGYEVARQFREKPWGSNAVLVALTGWGQEDDRRQAKEAGFDHHMVKPVDLDLLNDILTAVPDGVKGDGRA